MFRESKQLLIEEHTEAISQLESQAEDSISDYKARWEASSTQGYEWEVKYWELYDAHKVMCVEYHTAIGSSEEEKLVCFT